MKKADSERLTEILTNLHKGVVIEVAQKRRRAPTKYKSFEPYEIRTFFESYDAGGKTLLEIGAETLSGLLRAHPFPNANHRTTIVAIELFFKANDVRFPYYERAIPR